MFEALQIGTQQRATSSLESVKHSPSASLFKPSPHDSGRPPSSREWRRPQCLSSKGEPRRSLLTLTSTPVSFCCPGCSHLAMDRNPRPPTIPLHKLYTSLIISAIVVPAAHVLLPPAPCGSGQYKRKRIHARTRILAVPTHEPRNARLLNAALVLISVLSVGSEFGLRTWNSLHVIEYKLLLLLLLSFRPEAQSRIKGNYKWLDLFRNQHPTYGNCDRASRAEASGSRMWRVSMR